MSKSSHGAGCGPRTFPWLTPTPCLLRSPRGPVSCHERRRTTGFPLLPLLSSRAAAHAQRLFRAGGGVTGRRAWPGRTPATLSPDSLGLRSSRRPRPCPPVPLLRRDKSLCASRLLTRRSSAYAAGNTEARTGAATRIARDGAGTRAFCTPREGTVAGGVAEMTVSHVASSSVRDQDFSHRG